MLLALRKRCALDNMINLTLLIVVLQGSGKTLAFGLPIIHYLLSQPRPSPTTRRPLRALILAPTRELALQVSSHLNACLTNAVPTTTVDPDEKPGQPKPPPHVSCAAVVGGMSSQKQRRILDRGVDILVATPGRLWDIMETVRLHPTREFLILLPTF